MPGGKTLPGPIKRSPIDERNNVMRKIVSVILALCALLALAAPAAAGVAYLPGVTEEMTDPAYWTGGMSAPDALLATAEEIAEINAAALTAEGANMHDLRSLPETFDGVARCESLQAGVAADAAYYLGWTWDETGKKLVQADFDPIIANCIDPDAAREMPLRYGVAVRRTALITFPSPHQILDDPADFDFDYQPIVGIRVNEPVAVFTSSADGEYYQICNSCCSGWVRAEDVALCADRAEWLSAWDIPAEKRLVFWGDKMYTDYSVTHPETSGRLLTMGTVLERMDAADPDALVTNRLPIHNYAVYLPVRNDDGSYAKVPALLNAREKLSEDYLPLTGANLTAVALASLGDAYGWGGGLYNEDCSSLNRTVYECFGLDLPRNGNWQWNLAMPKADTAAMTSEEKAALLDVLPLGTLLNFPGHQMLYLGKADGAYYVVSTVSSIMSPWSGARQRTRDVQINTLDIRRANGKTWLEALTTAYIPWQYLPEGEEPSLPALPWYHEGTAFCLAHSLIDAFDGGWFRPEAPATRAVAAEAIWRAAGRPEPGEGAAAFPDAEPGAGYETAALWARERGILLGVGEDLAPEAPLTREMLAVLLWRCAAVLGLDAAAPAAPDGFPDAGETSDWAADAVAWAVGAGLLRGDADGRLDPRGETTRAELAVVLSRMKSLVAPDESET